MPITYCPECDVKIVFSRERAETAYRCKLCGHRFVLPFVSSYSGPNNPGCVFWILIFGGGFAAVFGFCLLLPVLFLRPYPTLAEQIRSAQTAQAEAPRKGTAPSDPG